MVTLVDLKHMVYQGIESKWLQACHAAAKRQPTICQRVLPARFFLLRWHAKRKKRDISFENEEGLKGNARNCLYSEKAECLHGNTGGFVTHT